MQQRQVEAVRPTAKKKKKKLQIELINIAKNANRPETNQLASCKRGRGFELGDNVWVRVFRPKKKILPPSVGAFFCLDQT